MLPVSFFPARNTYVCNLLIVSAFCLGGNERYMRFLSGDRFLLFVGGFEPGTYWNLASDDDIFL
jgi:hypothetical protein